MDIRGFRPRYGNQDVLRQKGFVLSRPRVARLGFELWKGINHNEIIHLIALFDIRAGVAPVAARFIASATLRTGGLRPPSTFSKGLSRGTDARNWKSLTGRCLKRAIALLFPLVIRASCTLQRFLHSPWIVGDENYIWSSPTGLSFHLIRTTDHPRQD